jgi:hypothetical protein
MELSSWLFSNHSDGSSSSLGLARILALRAGVN